MRIRFYAVLPRTPAGRWTTAVTLAFFIRLFYRKVFCVLRITFYAVVISNPSWKMDNRGSISVFYSSILLNSDLRIPFYAVVSRTPAGRWTTAVVLVFLIRLSYRTLTCAKVFTQLYLAPELEDGQPR